MRAPPVWTPQKVDELNAHLVAGLSYAQIARAMGVSRVAVAGAVRRHVHGIVDERTDRRRAYDRRHWRDRRAEEGHLPSGRMVQGHRWSEEFLTEPWAVRKLRRELEAQR